MLWESRLEKWANAIRHQANLPLVISLWNKLIYRFGEFEHPQVSIHLSSPSAAASLISPSLAKLGSAYVEGKLDVEGKLSDVIRIGYELARLSLKPEGRFGRMVRTFRHNRKEDKAAIAYHYDVSNDFYRLWLDEQMVYSCAYFENGEETLDQAQIKKIDHILTKIRLQPGQTLLDIGCGWGALVLRAAQQFGAQCVGITLSEKQFELATQRVRAAGLEKQIEIRLMDYRDMTGQFDRITSVGMFEHVGLQHLPEYFARIGNLLKDDGLVMNHGITSTDPGSGETPYGGGEFIERYVFPHGELPHVSLVLRSMQQAGLECFDLENLRRHYAHTCAIWADNFEQHATQIKQLAGEKRYRIWRLYLAGCAYAFEHDQIALYQVVCGKAGLSASTLPWSRHYMYQTDMGTQQHDILKSFIHEYIDQMIDPDKPLSNPINNS